MSVLPSKADLDIVPNSNWDVPNNPEANRGAWNIKDLPHCLSVGRVKILGQWLADKQV